MTPAPQPISDEALREIAEGLRSEDGTHFTSRCEEVRSADVASALLAAREALRYYADPKQYATIHHELSGFGGEVPILTDDRGARARTLLPEWWDSANAPTFASPTVPREPDSADGPGTS